MSRASRILIGVCLPVFTLLLGWQLGMRYAEKRLEDVQMQLETLYDAGTGSGQTVTDPEKSVDVSLLWSVWRLLLARYIAPEDMDSEKMVMGAVRGMTDAVGDPYTVFMDRQENQDFRQILSGHLQGIGAELALRKGLIVIVAPLKGSPAEKAGLMPQDVVAEVDGVSMEGKSLQEAVTKIRGEQGSTVTLTILREKAAAPLKKTIVREDIRIPSAEFKMQETGSGKVAQLTVNQFGNDTIQEVDGLLRANVIGKDGLKGLIIDLRYNGGGYLEGAVELVSRFLESGRVVTVERRDSTQNHDAFGGAVLPDLPIAVLINEGTASASEIVAGALQDHDRATIVGKKSFGKGTVQEVLDLPGGSSLRVTIARWLTPDGRDLGKEGVTPDIVVERTDADIEADKDPQLHAALEWLLDHEDLGVKTGSGSAASADRE